ncbi:MAG: spermidine/putrescine ABC transporter substrate-binding protein [Caldilineales bacterium]|nr:spermidine/putrescine ABC transporter substrate-binding protein [Caldilineales bacterium]
MKRKILALTLVLTLALLLAACAQSAPAEQPAAQPAPAQEEQPAVSGDVQPASEIVVYNWSEYIDPDIYSQFTDATGISVIEDNFSSNEEMLAKLQGGAAGYALTVPSDYTVAIMIEEGMLSPLDHANVPNLANLGERFRNLPYDPGNQYCVPYQWGTTGLGYDSAVIDEPASYAAIFEPDPNSAWYGRTTMLDDPRESFAAALVYLGYDINTTDEGQLEEAKQALIRAREGLAGFDSDTFEDLVASGENVMAHGWNGDFLVVQEENEDVAYVVPEEGGVVWVDNICIPASASPEQKLAAEMFINYLLEAEVGAQLSEYNYYASPNAASEELLDPEFLEDPTVYPPAEVLEKLQYIRPVGEAESLFQRLWDEVKTAS